MTQVIFAKIVQQIANDKDNRDKRVPNVRFLRFIYVITIVCFIRYGDFPLMSNAASEHGSKIDNLMMVSMVLIFIVQTVTQFFLYYFAYKYKGQKGNKALFYSDNHKLEFLWTIIPAVVLTILITYGLLTWSDIMNVDQDEDPIVIELYAQQFNWKARYAGEDNVLGESKRSFN